MTKLTQKQVHQFQVALEEELEYIREEILEEIVVGQPFPKYLPDSVFGTIVRIIKARVSELEKGNES